MKPNAPTILANGVQAGGDDPVARLRSSDGQERGIADSSGRMVLDAPCGRAAGGAHGNA